MKMKVAMLAIGALALALSWLPMPANASWVLVPGDSTDRNLHGCGSSWEICKYRRAPKVVPQVNGHAGGCNSVCQAKCQASWQVGGYRNVGACYAAWAKINAMGMNERCEAASRARG